MCGEGGGGEGQALHKSHGGKGAGGGEVGEGVRSNSFHPSATHSVHIPASPLNLEKYVCELPAVHSRAGSFTSGLD